MIEQTVDGYLHAIRSLFNKAREPATSGWTLAQALASLTNTPVHSQRELLRVLGLYFTIPQKLSQNAQAFGGLAQEQLELLSRQLSSAFEGATLKTTIAELATGISDRVLGQADTLASVIAHASSDVEVSENTQSELRQHLVVARNVLEQDAGLLTSSAHARSLYVRVVEFIVALDDYRLFKRAALDDSVSNFVTIVRDLDAAGSSPVRARLAAICRPVVAILGAAGLAGGALDLADRVDAMLSSDTNSPQVVIEIEAPTNASDDDDPIDSVTIDQHAGQRDGNKDT